MSTGTRNRGEVYAGGRHLATYFGGTTYFIHADWLGTERARSGVTGRPYETCTSLPFGDWLTCSGSDPSPMHFTGKEHDTETNLEDFGARYSSSAMGRFMTPDWSAKVEPVPYARLYSPQSLNLYRFVLNNPLTNRDLDGHWCVWGIGSSCPPPPQPVIYSTVWHGQDVTAVTSTQTTTTKAKYGTITTVVTTAAFFSNEAGHEGEYRGAEQIRSVSSTSPFSDTVAYRGKTGGGLSVTTKSIDLDSATRIIGGVNLGRAQATSATPNRAEYFAFAVVDDAQRHPVRYAFRAGGLALPFAGVPTLLEGAITGVEALDEAMHLHNEMRNQDGNSQ